MTNKDDCERHGGRELALDGMVNICELLINVVRTNKLKTLISLNQKVRGEVWRASPFSHRRQNRHRRTGRMKLTRFGGQGMIGEKGNHNAKITSTLSPRIPSAHH